MNVDFALWDMMLYISYGYELFLIGIKCWYGCNLGNLC